MRHRKTRRFRHRSNGRKHHFHSGGIDQRRLRPSPSFSNGPMRNNFKTPQNAEKLVEKYNALAKEALSSGDKILSENYLQHADHFMRTVEIKKLNQIQNKTQVSEDQKISSTNSSEKAETKQVPVVEEKKE